MILTLVALPINSLIQVFTSVSWTLAYGELNGERAGFALV